MRKYFPKLLRNVVKVSWKKSNITNAVSIKVKGAAYRLINLHVSDSRRRRASSGRHERSRPRARRTTTLATTRRTTSTWSSVAFVKMAANCSAATPAPRRTTSTAWTRRCPRSPTESGSARAARWVTWSHTGLPWRRGVVVQLSVGLQVLDLSSKDGAKHYNWKHKSWSMRVNVSALFTGRHRGWLFKKSSILVVLSPHIVVLSWWHINWKLNNIYTSQGCTCLLIVFQHYRKTLRVVPNYCHLDTMFTTTLKYLNFP